MTIVIFGFYYIRFRSPIGSACSPTGAGISSGATAVSRSVPERFHAPLDVMTSSSRRKYSSDIKPGDITALFGLNAQHVMLDGRRRQRTFRYEDVG